MTITLLTLFPDYFNGPLATSMLKRAQAQGIVTINRVNIRDFALDPHRTTDDRPFGGGPGMVLLVEPIDRALQSVVPPKPERDPAQTRVVVTSAKGQLFTQDRARTYAHLDHLVLICGHYEGIDERVIEHLADEEVRIGDYVLTGGEPAAAVLLDSVIRLLPGTLGNQASTQGESHDQPGSLGYPQYSRPQTYQGWSVPPVLLGGNHAEIERWRQAQRRSENG